MSGAKHAVPALERARELLSGERVSLGVLFSALEGQATYLLLLLFALVGTMPGASIIAGFALCVLSIGLIMAPGSPRLPGILAARELPGRETRYALQHAIHALRFVENLFTGSRLTIPAMLRLPAGVLMVILGSLMFVPIPLSNVPPALAAAALALALIEDSAVLLMVAGSGALGAIALLAGLGVTVARLF